MTFNHYICIVNVIIILITIIMSIYGSYKRKQNQVIMTTHLHEFQVRTDELRRLRINRPQTLDEYYNNQNPE